MKLNLKTLTNIVAGSALATLMSGLVGAAQIPIPSKTSETQLLTSGKSTKLPSVPDVASVIQRDTGVQVVAPEWPMVKAPAPPAPPSSVTSSPRKATAPSPSRSAKPSTNRRGATPPPVQGTGKCGGDLPPCRVLAGESGGNPNAVNPTGCGGRGCYGKWQFDPRTSQSLGYDKPMNQYPEEVQDQAARDLLARDGCGQWSTC